MPIKRRPSDDDDRPRRSRDEEDEKPTRRRPRDEDEESDLPARTLRGAKKARDDEDDDDDRPRRRAARDDDDDDDRPRRRAARDDEDDDKPRRRSRSRDDEDEDAEDDKPSKSRRAPRDDEDDEDDEDASNVVKSGWGAARRAREESGDFLQEMKFDGKGASLVKFLEDEPFAVYPQHWIENPPKWTKKKSWACMGRKGGCPVCAMGDKPDQKYAFNIAVLDAKDEPAVRALIAGPRLLGVLEEKNDGKLGPLTKHYWSLNRTGKGSDTAYPMDVVKSRDLAEDWDMDEDVILDDLRSVTPYTKKDIKIANKGDLQRIAKHLLGDDDDDEDDDDEDERPRRRR